MTTRFDIRADAPLNENAGGRRHQYWVLILAALAIVVGLALPALSIEAQFWIVLVPIMVIGLSHGGADPMILQRLASSRTGGVPLAVVLYVSAAAAFVALIWWLPTLALLTFLLLSVWHFGYTDTAFNHSGLNQPLVWLSGSLVIIGPMLGHPLQTGELFAWLVGRDPVQVGTFVRLAGPVLAGLWLSGLAVMLYCHRGKVAPRALAELLLLAGALVILPPLIAFALYFCGVHSLRHFLAIIQLSEGHTQRQATVSSVIRLAGPATAVAITIAVLAWWLLISLNPDTRLLTEAIRVMFWALAALTLPHALVIGLWWGRALSD